MLQPAMKTLEIQRASVAFTRERTRFDYAEQLARFEKFWGGTNSTAGPARSAKGRAGHWQSEQSVRDLLDEVARVAEVLPSSKERSPLGSFIDESHSLGRISAISEAFRVDLADLMTAARRASLLDWEVTFRTPRRFRRLQEMSAGQLLLLSLFSRLAANILPDSLVLIDEPEVGLHPSWQSALVPLIHESLPADFGCHVFIATHSPHVVSDASDVLVPGAEWGEFETFEEPFFGRSVENLLYRAFGARVTGNSVVNRDIIAVMQFVSRASADQTPSDEVRGAYERLQGIAGEDTKTLNNVLTKVSRKMVGMS